MLNRLTYNAQNQVASTAVPTPSWAPYFCWAYDAFGNRLQQSTSNAAFTRGDATCTVNGTQYQNTLASYSAQNQVASTNAPGFTWTPSYDNAGDVTNDGKDQYLYDAEGRLCAVFSEGNFTGYLYDAAGNRVAKGTISTMSCDITTNGFAQTAGYVVGPSGEQLTEVDGSNNWKHTNVYASGKQIGTYDGNVSAPTMHYYFDDPLGTRRAQASSAGVLEAVYVSLPFGDGYAANTSDDPTENHYTGKERDTESGNDYFLARYYNSAVGRFMSPDWSASVEPVPYAKLGDPQTLNLYSYAYNNPLGMVDVDGHDGCTLEGMPQTSATCSFLKGWAERAQTETDKAEGMIKAGWGEAFGAFGSFISAAKNKLHFRVTSRIVPDPDGTQLVVADSADLLGLSGAVLGNTPLGLASSAISVVNDPSLENIGITGETTLACYAFPELSVPVTAGTVAWDGIKLTNQVIVDVFTPDGPQSQMIGDGYGHLIPNPSMMDGSEMGDPSR